MRKSQKKILYSIPGWEEFVSEYRKQNRDFLPFEEARKFVRNLNLNGKTDWKKWSKSSRPYNIPESPHKTYKNSGWINWGDFLGTGTIATYNRKYRSFEEARNFARKLKLSSKAAWQKWSKSGNRPNNIPSNPNITYKDSGWVSWGNFLGNKNIRRNNDFCSFEEARTFACKLKLSGKAAWQKWIKSGNRPDMPSTPDAVYKNSGWVSWGDFLGTGNIRIVGDFCSFEKARKFARNSKLNSKVDWEKWCKSGNRPSNIPSNPPVTYKDSWKSWGDFFGTENVHKKNFRPFKEARKFARNLKLNGNRAWNKWSKSNKRPNDIPSCPHKIYKDYWISWPDWLGKE